MPIDETKLNDLPGRFVTDPGMTGHVTDRGGAHEQPGRPLGAVHASERRR
jgi:hypothetical protein